MKIEGLSLQAQDYYGCPPGINTSGQLLISAGAGQMWVQGVTEKKKEHENKRTHLWQEGKVANRSIQKTVTASSRM